MKIARLAAAGALLAGCAALDMETASFPAPLVIGHRGGATGYLPDHTLENYALGIDLGADFVEPDLVATKDGHLIARHEPNLVATTNVKDLPQFADRRRKVVIDGAEEEGFFAADFTLDEIRTLRAVQPLADRDQRFNGRFAIPTLDEIIALVKRKSKEKRRPIGIYPETKHSEYHRGLGLALEDRLLAALERAGWNHRAAPVFIQSFETGNLRELRAHTAVKLIRLVDGKSRELLTPVGLDEVRTYADGIGPAKSLLIGNTVIADAHARGLLVHPYTFRNEPKYVASAYGGNALGEYLGFYEAGVDGVFSDFADTAFAARAMFLLSR